MVIHRHRLDLVHVIDQTNTLHSHFLTKHVALLLHNVQANLIFTCTGFFTTICIGSFKVCNKMQTQLPVSQHNITVDLFNKRILNYIFL